MRAVLDLLARNIQRRIEVALGNQLTEFGRAGDIGALTDIDEGNFIGFGKRLQARQTHEWRGCRNGAWAFFRRRRCNGFNMVGRGAATTAENIDQSGFGKFTDNHRHFIGQLVIFAKLIGQTGIRINADIGIGDAGDFRHIGTHFVSPERAIQTNGKGLGVAQRVPKRFCRLSRKRAPGFIGNRA